LGDKKISFSKEVAETLGLESAVILDLYNQKVLDNNSYDDLFSSIEENAKYLSAEKIKTAIDKLVKYKFITVRENNGKQDFVVRSASKNTDSNSLTDAWMPSNETYEVIAMTKIPEEFISLKLKEFKSEIIDKKRINFILNKIKQKSKKLKIDPKITNRIWKNMIWSYIDYERRNFKKK